MRVIVGASQRGMSVRASGVAGGMEITGQIADVVMEVRSCSGLLLGFKCL